ncbi:hypothetical protein BH10PSE13_BH10PSE13_03640 [soil metagenome]
MTLKDAVNPDAKLSKGDRTRALIRRVARQIFTEREDSSSPMDEIALRAGISRATVYSHYPNRDAILFALLEQDWAHQAQHYREFVASPVIDIATVRKWILREAAMQRGGNKCLRLYSILMGQNRDAFERQVQNRDKLIEILGSRFEPFRIGDPALVEERERRMAAILMMFQIEQFCAHCAHIHAVGDVRIGADVLASKFLSFVEGAN